MQTHKKLKENGICNWKVNQGILPLIEVGNYQFEKKEP